MAAQQREVTAQRLQAEQLQASAEVAMKALQQQRGLAEEQVRAAVRCSCRCCVHASSGIDHIHPAALALGRSSLRH